MKRSWLRKLMVVLAVFIVALGLVRWKLNSHKGYIFPDYGQVTSFSLTDQDNKKFGSTELTGKVWVADFFFTRCAGPCPLLTTRMQEIQKKFSGRNDFALVSFSVDPEFDQPAVLTKYAKDYNADGSNWKFLTGPTDAVYGLIRSSFKMAVAPNQQAPAGEIDIMHSLYFALVDRTGHVRGFYDTSDAAALAQLKLDIAHL